MSDKPILTHEADRTAFWGGEGERKELDCLAYVEVRTGGSATVGAITELTMKRMGVSIRESLSALEKAIPKHSLNVETTLGIGVVSSDFARDSYGRVLVILRKLDYSLYLFIDNGWCIKSLSMMIPYTLISQ